uniref:UBR-type domain-containing protein n=1 Tax=Heterorhabditis bacteriophora TaxID=37862 RepID=A0A1I7XCF0_HETBA
MEFPNFFHLIFSILDLVIVHEDVDDPLVTIQDVLDVDRYNKETARCLLGGQDSSVCTYPEGYKPRQPLFACLTCTPPPNGGGVCYGCSVHCHEGHMKASFNPHNMYNDNFAGVFCVCKKLFPNEIDEPMLQCAVCEDWFHLSHLDEKLNTTRDIDEVADTQSLVCYKNFLVLS